MNKKENSSYPMMVGTLPVKNREALDAELTDIEDMLWNTEMRGLRYKDNALHDVDYLSTISDKLTLLIMVGFDVLEQLKKPKETHLVGIVDEALAARDKWWRGLLQEVNEANDLKDLQERFAHLLRYTADLDSKENPPRP